MGPERPPNLVEETHQHLETVMRAEFCQRNLDGRNIIIVKKTILPLAGMAEFAATAAADVIAALLGFAALSRLLNVRRNHARDAFAFVAPFLLASQ